MKPTINRETKTKPKYGQRSLDMVIETVVDDCDGILLLILIKIVFELQDA